MPLEVRTEREKKLLAERGIPRRDRLSKGAHGEGKRVLRVQDKTVRAIRGQGEAPKGQAGGGGEAVLIGWRDARAAEMASRSAAVRPGAGWLMVSSDVCAQHR